MTITIKYWKWSNGQNKEVYDLPRCKDGYLRKKPARLFLEALSRLKGRKIRVEIDDHKRNALEGQMGKLPKLQ